MRIGNCAYSYRQHLQSGSMTLQDFLRISHEQGLDGVELTSYYFPTEEKSYLHEIKRLAARYGLHISGTAVGNNFCQADAAAREEHLRMTKRWIDHAVTLGAPCIRVFAGPVPEGRTQGEAFKWCVSCLRKAATYGKRRGIMVALENHGGITSTADQVDRLLRAAKNPWLGLNLDFGNYHTPYEEYAQSAPHACTTHAKVSYRDREGQRQKVDYHRVRQIMAQAGYHGYISIEYEEEEDPHTGVPRFVEELKAAFRS